MIDYPRDRKRRAEILFPPNALKAKVGSGGIDEKLIVKAQKIIEETKVDFLPIGQRYLKSLEEGLSTTKANRGRMDEEALIATMLYPAMQLKANGGMFGYPLVTAVAARLIRFLEHINDTNDDALEVINAYVETLSAILLMGEGNRNVVDHVADIHVALDEACTRYFEKHGN
ncbi:MAG: hypothetical protein EBQ96_08050 [Proteobacteria bacterium]|nr:hypothetical protein [Pseudomonadota bacterium]